MIEKTRPFFSIGVTTYDRIDLLKEALSSIVTQNFPDFEVIVGNDNPAQALSPEILKIHDERITFVNRERNLGEIANMADLLDRSRGRYFTWLADDDLYSRGFLERVHQALVECGYPSVVFSSYWMGVSFHDQIYPASSAQCRWLTGGEFLKAYLSRSIMAIGCYGVFRKEYLQKIKGMEQLGRGFSPYADNWLVIKTALLDQVVYLDSPLLFFRAHKESISYTSHDVDAYLSAQKDLVSKSCVLFRSECLAKSFHNNLYLLLVWCVRDFGAVISRSRSVKSEQVYEYIAFLVKYLKKLKGSLYYPKTCLTLMKTTASIAFHVVGRNLSSLRSNRKKGVSCCG